MRETTRKHIITVGSRHCVAAQHSRTALRRLHRTCRCRPLASNTRDAPIRRPDNIYASFVSTAPLRCARALDNNLDRRTVTNTRIEGMSDNGSAGTRVIEAVLESGVLATDEQHTVWSQRGRASPSGNVRNFESSQRSHRAECSIRDKWHRSVAARGIGAPSGRSEEPLRVTIHHSAVSRSRPVCAQQRCASVCEAAILHFAERSLTVSIVLPCPLRDCTAEHGRVQGWRLSR